MRSSAVAFGVAAFPIGIDARPIGRDSMVSFHRDHILGTSLDLHFCSASEKDAEEAEQIAMFEIERLRKIFSLYDSTSELSNLNRANSDVAVSEDLRRVLSLYDHWQPLTGWACNAQVGELKRIWNDAAREGIAPDADRLKHSVEMIRSPAWQLSESTGRVRKLNQNQLDLNAVAKGYIIQRVASAVRDNVASIRAGLVNLGGDMTAWGEQVWPIGVQDPFSPAENAQPIAGLILDNCAIATSGGYQRFLTIGGRHYSHLIDPRTGYPANAIASATVIAPESATANVLATTLCVLGIDEGLRLIASIPGAECLIATPTGQIVSSPGINLMTIARVGAMINHDDKKPKANPWPEGYQVKVSLELPKIDNAKKYRRPYVAVWIEDADGKAVRTLGVWGNAPKYLKDLSDWWKIGKDDKDLIKAVTRATRGPGKYDLIWDGKDDKGKLLGQGTYTLRVEVHREFGKHLRQTSTIECLGEAASVNLEKNEETGETTVEYGKKK